MRAEMRGRASIGTLHGDRIRKNCLDAALEDNFLESDPIAYVQDNTREGKSRHLTSMKISNRKALDPSSTSPEISFPRYDKKVRLSGQLLHDRYMPSVNTLNDFRTTGYWSKYADLTLLENVNQRDTANERLMWTFNSRATPTRSTLSASCSHCARAPRRAASVSVASARISMSLADFALLDASSDLGGNTIHR